MEIRYIREFVVLAESDSFVDAAARLYMTQSSLSKHLKTLESELGAPLFNRTTRRVELNELGRVFLPYARQIAALCEGYEQAVEEHLAGQNATLVVGAPPVMAEYGITEVIARFRRSAEPCDIRLREEDSVELAQLLRSGECELAFLRQAEAMERDLVRIPYADDSLVAVLRQDHALAGGDNVDLRQLAGESFLLLPEQTAVHSLCLQACRRAGFAPHIFYTGHRVENILMLVASGLGVSLLMKRHLEYLPHEGLAVLPLSPAVVTQISLCCRKGASLSPGARQFIRCLHGEGN